MKYQEITTYHFIFIDVQPLSRKRTLSRRICECERANVSRAVGRADVKGFSQGICVVPICVQ